MPWSEKTIVNLRKEFVFRALQPGANIAQLCRDHGISRKTGYKWLERYRERGVAGLVDQSRRPSSSPLAVSAEVALDVVRLRREHPRWGAKKIRELLVRNGGGEEPPSVRTVARVLERAGEVRRRRKRSKPLSRPCQAPAVETTRPNQLWTIDFKGWWRTGDGCRCEPLTVRDAYSRFVLSVCVLPGTGSADVREEMTRLFEKYGLPDSILSDNGSPFVCTRSLCGLTRLSAWWRSLGIEHLRSRPGKPQDNGGHERMHGDMRIDLEDSAAESLEAQQAACDEWRDEFNYLRPHEALDMRTPSELYRPSNRVLSRLVVGGYPDGCELRRVNRNGYFDYRGRRIRASKALQGYQVAIEAGEVEARVWFYDLLIGVFTIGLDMGVRAVTTPVTVCHLEHKQGDGVEEGAPSDGGAVDNLSECYPAGQRKVSPMS